MRIYSILNDYNLLSIEVLLLFFFAFLFVLMCFITFIKNQNVIHILSDFSFISFHLPLLRNFFIFYFQFFFSSYSLLYHNFLHYDGTSLRPQLTLFYLILLYHFYMEGRALTKL